jgi:hypothetical protein
MTDLITDDNLAQRLDAAREALGWSIRHLSHRLGSADASIRRMIRGKRHLPTPLVEWAETLADALADVPVHDTGEPMSADELRDLLETIGWGFDVAAERLADDRRHMARMLDGRVEVPPSIAGYLRAYSGILLEHPARPQGWGGPGRHAVRDATAAGA